MDRPRTHFVIVGGGTAGWLAALMVQRQSRTAKLPIDITVVESSKIPTIGVGEGTTAVFRQTLMDLDINEVEFVRNTGASVKLGIRHKDWRRKGFTYDGPIDDPNLLALTNALKPDEQLSALHIYAVSQGRRVQDIHLFGELMARKKAPFGLEGEELIPAGPFQHALHFDQARVGAYLRQITRGVERVDAEVAGLRKNPETGLVEALLTTDGREVAGDFFIDCTGFRRKLIREGMGATWNSYQSVLPVNRAMPFWLDYDEGREIGPYTLAWAQQAGWMWGIPTIDRIGCGYVYSDRFCTPERAKEEIEQALGKKIEVRADFGFDAGRLDRAWVGNCVAFGLAQSFLEPLEATSIHGSVVQLWFFTRFFLKDAANATDKMRGNYNAVVARQLDDFRTFLNLHYTGERPEPFWVHARTECVHETTRAHLDRWKKKMPRRPDFWPLPDNLAHINEQLYYPVLDGLGHLQRDVAQAEMAANPKVRAHARKSVDAHVKDYKKAASKCLGHREYMHLVADGKVRFNWH